MDRQPKQKLDNALAETLQGMLPRYKVRIEEVEAAEGRRTRLLVENPAWRTAVAIETEPDELPRQIGFEDALGGRQAGN